MLEWLLNWWNGLNKKETLPKEWICTITAAYVNEKNEPLYRWRYLMFVDTEGNRTVDVSVNKKQQDMIEWYGGVWNHPQYTDIIVPWLHGCAINVAGVNCYNNSEDLAHHFSKRKKHTVDVVPDNSKKSATILKLVKKDDDVPKPSA